ncbi:MAG: NFACT RNA binding domain-containing protein [Candidatus ainarchaeum sp.]|nr:NFACT RNA binding domain-containing protein [Candidatus ainarchaeum sp.]
MRIRLNIGKSVHENAAAYYEEAKEAREKIKGLEKAMEETKKEIVKAEKEEAAAERKKNEETKIARKKEWYEKFHYFFTDGGKLVVGGRSADQNDLVYKTYLEDGDLFFHADIQGGSACVMKDGLEAGEGEKKQVAQFAACFSNAWKNGNAAVDVYCVKKDQVSKHAQGGFIGKGAFAIEGEREWFRKTELKLKAGVEKGLATALPARCERKLEKEVFIIPGNEEKGVIVKKLAKLLNTHPDEIQNLLPSGKGKIVKM